MKTLDKLSKDDLLSLIIHIRKDIKSEDAIGLIEDIFYSKVGTATSDNVFRIAKLHNKEVEELKRLVI